MPIFLQNPQPRTDVFLEDIPATFGEFAEATAEQAWSENVSPSLSRMSEQGRLRRREAVELDPLSVGTSGVDVPRGSPQDLTYITQEEARAQAKAAGFSQLEFPEEGTTKEYTNWLINRHQLRAARESVYARSPDTLGYAATGVGLSILTSMADPLEIGLALIPGLGEARLAHKLVKGGSFGARAAARFEVGATVAALESAAMEPIVYAQQQREQMDYTLYDSLLNIGFSSLAGGTLRSLGGAGVDFYRARTAPPLPTPAPAAIPSPTAAGVGAAVRAPSRADDIILSNLRQTDRLAIQRAALNQFLSDTPININGHVDVINLGQTMSQARQAVSGPTPERLIADFRNEQWRINSELERTSQQDITVVSDELNVARTELARLRQAGPAREAEATEGLKRTRNARKKAAAKLREDIKAAEDRVARAERAVNEVEPTKVALRDDASLRDGVVPAHLQEAFRAYRAARLEDWRRLSAFQRKMGQRTPMSEAVRQGLADIEVTSKQDITADPQAARANNEILETIPDDEDLAQSVVDIKTALKQRNPELDIEARLREVDPTYNDKVIVADAMQGLAACLR